MLVLTRKVGESIIIDGGITVTITSIERNKVRIGFSAPPDVAIMRSELRARDVTLELPEDELVGV